MKKWFGVALLLIFAVACSTTQSGQHKTIKLDELMKLTVSGESQVDIYIDLGGLATTTEADTTSGDADAVASVDPAVALGMQGSTTSAAAKGAEQMLEDIVSYAEQWLKKDADNTTTNTTNPIPPEPPSSGDNTIPDEPGDDGGLSGVDTILYTFPCEDLNFTYRDCELDEPGCESVPQLVCLFTEFNDCSEIPVESFTMMWKDPTGNERFLEVPKKCSIAMDSEANGYGKYRPSHDKEPYKPVAYAPRGFNASEVNIIGKKQ